MANCIGNHKTKYKFRDNDLNVWKDFAKPKVSKRRRNTRKNSYFYKKSNILNNENIKTFHNFQD